MKQRTCGFWLAMTAGLALSGPLLADHPTHLDELLNQVQTAQKRDAALRRKREQTFLAAHTERNKLLEALRQQVATERARGESLKTAFKTTELALRELEAELRERSGGFGELFGTVRQSAKDLGTFIEESLASAQYPERAAWFRVLGESKKLPDITELERLWLLIRQEIAESGRVVRMPATVIDPNGFASEREIVRVGLFNALQDGDYLKYQPESRRFVVLARQPSRSHQATARTLGAAETGYAAFALDPTRGALLGLLVETPSLLERVQQGGVIGYVILALGAVGLLIVLVRLVYLGWVGRRMRRQLRHLSAPSNDNPLGRVLAVSWDNRNTEPMNLELQIDEAVLRELPRLARGEGLVKLLAGVAPLLGLLGTVVGMIITFQAISLFGTGDPKLMANGISQALVTTALGLLIAIPLLFLHSLMAARSRVLVQMLDEQSLGLVAMSREQS